MGTHNHWSIPQPLSENQQNKYQKTKTIKFKSDLNQDIKGCNKLQWNGMLYNVPEYTESTWEGLERNGL